MIYISHIQKKQAFNGQGFQKENSKKMTMFRALLDKKLLFTAFCVFASATVLNAQIDESSVKKVNFRYSQNPKTKTKTADTENAPVNSEQVISVDSTNKEPETIAKKTLDIARKAGLKSLPPTEIYKVGIGDVIFINLQNAPKSSTYYTVLNDGTIDYPLAGEMVSVLDLTTEEIEILLGEKIKLYENPQVSVKVRDYASHTISVLGLVERSGEKKIQREAVPLFLVRAESLVLPTATKAIIRRADSKTETINLKDSKSDDVLIFPGDIIEFAADKISQNIEKSEFYYIGGEIMSGGQKDFHSGITLTQAILASGGLKKSNVKTVIIRRKNEAGLLSPQEYNLKLIKDGKQADPVLEIGDTIEVGN